MENQSEEKPNFYKAEEDILTPEEEAVEEGKESSGKKLRVHGGLFLITLLFTTFAGAEWMTGKMLFNLSFDQILGGLAYSVPFLAILTVHEFGHYFIAKYHKLKVTLPFYIPFWFMGLLPAIGTMGAFIKIKSFLRSRKQVFDVGVSGPLAGFLIILPVLWFGFTHLPPAEYVFSIHPEYEEYGLDYPKHVYENAEINMAMGTNLLMELGKTYLVEDPSLYPVPQEAMHYPWLFAGFLACFFTALNLLPVGQLDGGHVLYGMVGRKYHKPLSMGFFILMIFVGGLGTFSGRDPWEDLLFYAPFYVGVLYLIFERNFEDKFTALLVGMGIFTLQFALKTYFPSLEGFRVWLVFGGVVGRFLGVYHPPAIEDEPLSWKRKVLGWVALIVLILCFTPAPLEVYE